MRLSRSLGWLGRHLPLAAGATAITVVVGAAVAIAIARSGDEPASGGEAPSSDATLARATPATSPTPSPTPPVATPPRAVGIAACPDPDQSLCEFAAALENAWQKHAPIGELVAVSRGRDGSCGHTLEMNQADTCYGAGPGQSFADARFVTELENGDLTRFRPENYQAWLQRYRGSLSMSSPEGHDAFGPASVRVYSLGPGDAAICPGECRTIVMSGRYGPVEGDPKGTPAERHVILLTVEKGASGWAVVDTRYGEQSASQLEQLLHAHQPGFSEWWTEEHANWRPVP